MTMDRLWAGPCHAWPSRPLQKLRGSMSAPAIFKGPPNGLCSILPSFWVLVTHRRKPRSPEAGSWLNGSTRSEVQDGSPLSSPGAARISCLTRHLGRSVSAEHGGAPCFRSLLAVAADPTGGYFYLFSEVSLTRLRPAPGFGTLLRWWATAWARHEKGRFVRCGRTMGF